MKTDVINHYDLLIEENNDPVHDSAPLKAYMDKFDGEVFERALLPLENKSVLEIGVGTGRLAKIYAPQCREFCGIDISSKTVQRARENLKDEKVNLICADFLKYEFNQKFDVIYSSLTFMHIKEKLKAVKKISALLNVGGKFVLSITKSQNRTLDYGTRQITLYPDNPQAIQQILAAENFFSVSISETELAYVIVAYENEK